MFSAISNRFKPYYFRKLIRYLNSSEYRKVRALSDRTKPQMHISELLFLRYFLRKSGPATIVEIGSYCGASTSAMADVVKEKGIGCIYAIDLFGANPTISNQESGYFMTFDETMKPYEGTFKKIAGDSRRIAWDRPIDFLFIDGDHSEQGAQADILKYLPFLVKGGHIFLHDYVDTPDGSCRVKTVVDRILVSDPSYKMIGQVGVLIGFCKIR